MRAKFESFEPALRPWLPFVQKDLEGTRVDITEESAAGPAYEQDFRLINDQS